MNKAAQNFRPRDYWIVENAQYAEASFRLRKAARLINRLAGGRQCTLLDVGCGPAALQSLLDPNISYFGIDIAIHQPAANLREVDIARDTIGFGNKRFDFVVAFGLFEYMGPQQDRKLEEIRACLKDDGKFIMTYVNFGHCRRRVWPNYNNVQPIAEMTKRIERVFKIERRFPASHHWRPKQPGKKVLSGLQMYLNFNVPILSPLWAVEYLFVSSRGAS